MRRGFFVRLRPVWTRTRATPPAGLDAHQGDASGRSGRAPGRRLRPVWTRTRATPPADLDAHQGDASGRSGRAPGRRLRPIWPRTRATPPAGLDAHQGDASGRSGRAPGRRLRPIWPRTRATPPAGLDAHQGDASGRSGRAPGRRLRPIWTRTRATPPAGLDAHQGDASGPSGRAPGAHTVCPCHRTMPSNHAIGVGCVSDDFADSSKLSGGELNLTLSSVKLQYRGESNTNTNARNQCMPQDEHADLDRADVLRSLQRLYALVKNGAGPVVTGMELTYLARLYGCELTKPRKATATGRHPSDN